MYHEMLRCSRLRCSGFGGGVGAAESQLLEARRCNDLVIPGRSVGPEGDSPEFDESLLRLWLERDDMVMISRILRVLPSERFAPVDSVIAERFPRWEGGVALLAAPGARGAGHS
jgi:hypothetical protein